MRGLWPLGLVRVRVNHAERARGRERLTLRRWRVCAVVWLLAACGGQECEEGTQEARSRGHGAGVTLETASEVVGATEETTTPKCAQMLSVS